MTEIPLLCGKVFDEGIITPFEKSRNRLHIKKIDRNKFPKNGFYVFLKLYSRILRDLNPDIIEYHDDFSILIFKVKEEEIAFVYPTMGSYASCILEELISLGAKKLFVWGGVGTLSKVINRGDLIVPDKAIRDEAISYLYLEPSEFTFPSTNILKALINYLELNKISYHKGVAWTVSTPYKETERKLDLFCSKGAICVDMELASFFAIAQVRKIDLCALLLAGDSIAEKIWGSEKRIEQMDKIDFDRDKVFDLVLKFITEYDK